jgi:hypothetical protein
MLSFDRLKKNWQKIIATNSTEFNISTVQAPPPEKDMDEDKAQNNLEKKLKYIGKSLEVLRHSHPVTLDEKAIYDLAGTERAEIYNQKLSIEKTLEKQKISPLILDLMNTVFELGGNVRGYNMALGYQKYFEDAQKKQTDILKSAEKKIIDREAYFDIVKMVFDKIIKNASDR